MFNDKKKEDLLQIEKCFERIKQKEDVKGNLHRIERILKRQYGRTFFVTIVPNDRKFFGMTVYPEQSDVDMLVQSILKKDSEKSILDKYSKIDKWYIEIDEILLYDRNLNSNPAEITAVLMHEIGHTVHSNTIPTRLSKVILLDYLVINARIKSVIQDGNLQKILGIPAIETFAIKTFSSDPLKSEELADKFAVSQGYGKDLDSFVDKLLKSQGSEFIDKTEQEMENDIKIINQWAIENISELQFRKTKLREMLKTETMANPSPYIRRYISGVKSAFFGSDGDSLVKQMVTEQTLMSTYHQRIKESFIPFFDKFGRVRKVQQSEIDDIFIDVQRMANYDDSKYCLARVQDKLELVNHSLELLEGKEASKVQLSKTTLMNFKTQLEEMRSTIMSKKFNTPRQFIVIDYPKGYEG